MPPYSIRALVLRKTKLGETDAILTLLAADGRQVRAVAKGMRKPGSRFGGRLQPYSVADLLLHTGRTLDVISEAEVVEQHAALREDFDRSCAASVVADVLEKVSLEGQAEERLFALGDATLVAMEEADREHLSALVTAFLVKAMAMHGYRPELASCASCAETATGGHLFSLAAGGVLCPACGTIADAAVSFSEEARSLLERLLGMRMAEVAAADVDAGAVTQCFALMRDFVAYHLGARLRALEFFGRELM